MRKWSLGSWAYEWNANGSLKKVQRPDGSVITFKYDAFGRRISKTYHRREFLYIWDKNVPLHEIQKEELCEDNIITWIFEGFTPTAKLINGKAYSIISDHLGTPILAVDTQGYKVWEREFDIYGRVRKEFTHDNVKDRRSGFMPFLYAGQYYDRETELAYNRFRYYSPDTGAYISQDPIGLAGGNPTLYGYVFDGNTEVDIFGLDCWSTARKKFWKQEAINNPNLYSPNNIKRMKEGKAPKMTVEVINRKTGEITTEDYSLELHHTKIPQRVGGAGVHKLSNLTIVDPWQHEAIDPYRHVGVDKINVIKGVDIW